MSSIPIPQVEVVDTTDPEREVWEYVGYFESESYANNFRNSRISNGVVSALIRVLDADKQNHSKVKGNPQLRSLQQITAVDNAVGQEIAINAKQARDFYTTSKSMPMLSKPIILHYAFEKLANILILNTYDVTTPTYSHGLKFDPTTSNVIIMKEGLFARLHDCYSFDANIYAKGYQFKLDSLVNVNPITESEVLSIGGGHFGSVSVHESTTKASVQISEPDREFLFIFALSSLARYHVNLWSTIIDGKNSPLILRIRKYVQTCQRFFPNWVLNALHWKHLTFFSGARLG